VIDVAPGHDAWVVGDERAVSIEWSGVRGWLEPLESLNERVLATIVVTDIVDSTGHANRLGGSRWNDLLARHNARMRDIVSTFRGREIKTTGDGFLVVFDGAARAVRCAQRMVDSAREDRVSIRAAVHTGEIEFVGDDVLGSRSMKRVGPPQLRQKERSSSRRSHGTWRPDRVYRSRIEANTCSAGSTGLVGYSPSWMRGLCLVFP
jgi:Adenylate and Guanylate cyclase catalytic domain